MTKEILLLLLVLGLMTTASGYAEEDREGAAERRGVVAEDQQSERGRRRNRQRQVGVKDPAEFRAEGGEVFSGPQRGEKLIGFKAVELAGDNQGKTIDPIAVADGRPQVIFLQDGNGVAIRGLFGIVDAIGKIDEKTDQDLHVSCVFLADDPNEIRSRFGRVFPGLMERGIDVIAVSADGRDGPGTLGLDRTVSQTIILANQGEVTRNFVAPQGLLYVDPHVMGGVAELVSEDRATVTGWLAAARETQERMRMRRGNERQAETSNRFRQKLGELVRAGKISREEAAELMQLAFPAENSRRDRR